MTAFVCVLGGGFFLFCAIFIEKDRTETERLEREAMGQSLVLFSYTGIEEPVLASAQWGR